MMRPMKFTLRTRCTVLTLALLATAPPMALAVPLDAEACARLKQQKEALEAAGARTDLAVSPVAKPESITSERKQRIKSLLEVEGQLRFRCATELPIATLKPEPVEETAETSDTAGSAEPAAKKVVKRPKTENAKSATAKSDTPKSETPKSETPKTTAAPKSGPGNAASPAAKAASAITEQPAAKPRPKPRAPKADDAYRAPAPTDDAASPQKTN